MRAAPAVSVLFVDDDVDSLYAYRLVATEAGMIVEVAHDGREALALAGVLVPDVIVLDVGLRSQDGLDGLEVARRLRADVRTRAIPILFLSGYDGAAEVAEMRAAGGEGYMAKPCSADSLLARVTELATSRRDQANHGEGASVA
jgi:CheY-like chemotaxis protein